MVLDIILIILLLFAAIRGYKKGFSDIVLGIIGFILAIILAFSLKGFVADIIMFNTEIDEGINSFITENINLNLDGENMYLQIFKNLNLEDTLNNQIQGITTFLLESISFIGIFIITFIVIFIFKNILNLVFELPIIGGINKILGLIASLVIMVINIWILLLIFQVISPFAPQVIEAINNTLIVKIIYENNYLSNLIY